MHSAALAAADSMLANWLPQAPAASRVALEQAQQFYTVQAVTTTILCALCFVALVLAAVYLAKKATAGDAYNSNSDLFGGAAVVAGVGAVIALVVTAISIPEAAAFVFAGKAATVLRLVGKF